MTQRLKNHILGGLYGQALGDAMGMPAYFDPDTTRAKFDWIETLLPAPDDHHVHAGLPAGRITDDSEQAFSIAQAYIDNGGISIESAAQGIISWYDRVGGEASPYVGPSTKRGVTALKEGKDPRTTGVEGDTNGAPMRISPVGLMFPGHIMGAIDATITTCIPTHNTRPAISGACAVAAAIAHGMTEHATVNSVVYAGLFGAEVGANRAPKWLDPSVARRIELAVDIARRGGDVRYRLRELYDVVGASLSVPETVGSAFGAFVMAEGDPNLTAIYAANLSGDADTVAAIAAAIAGAYSGIDAIKPEYIAQLEADEIFQSYNVRDIAEGIYKIAE